MFKSIRTSKDNKTVVSELTKSLNLGPENIIARLAFAHSISSNKKLDLQDIKDSRGKEYSRNVLLGEFSDIYIALICQHYNLYKTDKDIPRYIKMHIDDGLETLYTEFNEQRNVRGIEFLLNKIEIGIQQLA